MMELINLISNPYLIIGPHSGLHKKSQEPLTRTFKVVEKEI